MIAGDPASLALLAEGEYTNAALTALARAIGFIPLVFTTAIVTGVYGAAGCTFVFVAGLFLHGNPLLSLIHIYSQFNNLDDVNIVLNALVRMGFDDVFEVSAAAELVSEATRQYISDHEEQLPFISTACPSVVRLIRVRFPNLIPHLLPLNPPVEVAAILAAEKAMKDTGLPREKIGIMFISPCPSKVTYVKAPLGTEKSQVDHVLAIKDVYPKLLACMKAVVAEDYPVIGTSGKIGISWRCV